MKEHRIERWEHIDTLGSPDILNGMLPNGWSGQPGVYPAGTSLNYAQHAYTRVPELGDADGKQLGLHFEGLDGVADIFVSNGDITYHDVHPEYAPWAGHYRPEFKMLCEDFCAGDEVEIWVFIHDAQRVNGVDWPVKWVYTTQEEAEALNAQTRKEWVAAKGEF